MSDFIIKYLALIRPAELDVAAVLRKDGDKYLRTCLFADMNGAWDGQRLRMAFQKYSYEWLGQEWYISQFRQAMAAFFHEHISNDPARDGYSQTKDVTEAQAGRSLAVGSRRYGNSDDTIDSMDPYLLESFSKVSKEWHRLLGQESIIPLTNQFILPMAYSSMRTHQSISHRSFITRSISDHDLLSSLRTFLGRPTVDFKSPAQKEAIHLAIKGTEDLLVVLPTGAGKSLIYLLPLFLDKTKPLTSDVRCTILISPFISLTQDILHRCSAFEIYVQEYKKSFRVDEHPKLNLLVVNIADAVCSEFWTQLLILSRQNRLSRLVMDEAHVVLTDVTYRACFAHVSKIRRSAVPWLLLTATLAPKDEGPLAQSFGVKSFRIIRMTTARPNIGYHVRQYKPNTPSAPVYNLIHPIAITAVNCIRKFPTIGSGGKVRDRIIVYCPTVYTVNSCKEAIDELYRTLDSRKPLEICSVYHGGLSDRERIEAFNKWRNGNTIAMVATKAFGTGVDFAHVRMILHYGHPDSFYDFAQQTGRAGRDGLPAISVTFWNSQYFRTITHAQDDAYLKMRDWVTNQTTCRRSLLQWAIDHDDGNPISETLPNFIPISRCRETTQCCDICSTLSLICDGTDFAGPAFQIQGTSFSESD